MLDAIINKFKMFRENIYSFFPHRQDASMDLIDSLSGNTMANSVIELSLNPLHRRNYASITRVLDEYHPENKKHQQQQLISLFSTCCPELKNRSYHVIGVDSTPNPRIYSPTVSDRGFVYAPNAISGNKPITIGHKYSVVTYFPEKNEQSPPWVVPLSCTRVGSDQKSKLIGMQQISECIQSNRSFQERICVSVGDSEYSHPACLMEAQNNPNQIHISRARNNRVFYYPSTQIKSISQRGRPESYGEKHSLRDETTWHVPDERISFEVSSKKMKSQDIKIDCWNKIMMRGKKESSMSDITFRLLRIRIYKSSGELLFKRPMWLIVSGEKHFKLSLKEIFNIYRQRFDTEHFFRFGKNRLLMNKIQTPDTNHEEAWWQIVMIAYVQLYLARELAENTLNPWEKYLPAMRSAFHEKSPTQVQRDFQRIIQMIGTPAKPPKPRHKSSGRKQGDIQPRRLRHPIVFKEKNATNALHNTT